MTPKEIVTRVSKLYKEQLKKSQKDGFHHPVLHESTTEINRLIAEFEEKTGQDWDKHAKDYL